jgi:hypothetical protein
MSPRTLRPLKPQSSHFGSTVTITTFFLFLCTFLILFPVGVVSAAPVVPLAFVPSSASANNATKNIVTHPLAAAADPQEQEHPEQTQNETMYGSEEQPVVENHQTATGADSSNQQQQFQSAVAVGDAATVPGIGSTPVKQQLQQHSQPISTRDPIYMWSSLAAGVGSGALASMLCAPLDLVRTRMQVWGQVVRSSKGAAAAAAGSAAKSLSLPGMLRDIIQRDGWRGCFRGLGATLVTVPTFWGVYCKLVII